MKSAEQTARILPWPRRAPRERAELEFLPAALEIIETPASPVGRAILFTIIAFFCIALAWATFGRVDIIATATGKIVPTSRTKIIQPLEAGVVRAIHVQVKTQNVGAVRVRFLAFYIVVLGDKIAPGLTNSGLNVVSPYFGIARTVVVYRYGFLTHTADPSVTADLQLEPGQFGEHDQVFYVPPAAFDRLRLYVVARFTRRTDAEIATALAPGQDNLPAFTGDTDNVETTSSLMTSLSMWEK